MKIYIKTLIFTLLVLGSLLFVQCTEVLDKTDLGNITEDLVWNDPVLATLNVNRLYQTANPGWSAGASALSDDAAGRNNTMYGRLTENSNSSYVGRYSNIRDANIILNGLDSGTIDEDDKKPLKGQALFFRALAYWRLVTTYGGVPLVLDNLGLNDELELPRSSTTETVAQIIADLDNAADLLPDFYANEDYGRITKGAAMAMKGRVLLHFASEHFDPDQSKGRWQAAYDALIAAKANLDANGKGLNSSYADLWFDDSNGNPEAIWTRLYNGDAQHSRDKQVRPFQPGIGGGRSDNATVSLLDSYPMLDGKKISDNTSAYSYDPVLLWKNRDPRFSATQTWNGDHYPLVVESPFQTNGFIWMFQNGITNTEADAEITLTGFYNRKAVDPTIPYNENSTTQWIEMRYAELLLNIAEAANEIGQGGEALTILYAIRDRAGIENLDGRFGLDVGLEGNTDEMREAILLERRIELAFEGNRSNDLRRRRLYGTLNGTERMGYYITKTNAFDSLTGGSILENRKFLETQTITGDIDLNEPDVYENYFTTEVYSIEENSDVPGQDGTDINYKENYYFFDIPESILNRNPNLEQTKGWPGGTFDPLK
ncbi:RagB/SusD family nutrient uptake outer membrane protein [Maribacter ulvicola]|uniref:Starch-binding associating with outer membrane n=1 Tax=Maribacter ulvicola TaxID=228959 RepID=A0A1N6Y980_9FLAO|nr:RagB/SusD family nutrient uptake outer membrane protein [Maribacter ulvicola]SIR11138.1 Starch-binding associating with outer membrane [Maribacter ulvicola]